MSLELYRNGLCPLCHQEVESIEHVLRLCNVAKEVWDVLFPDNVRAGFFMQKIWYLVAI